MVTRPLGALGALVALVGALASGATGCTLVTDSFRTNDFSGDAFPISVDTRSGAVVVGVREGDVDRRAVLDVLSPVTVIDPGPNTRPTVGTTDLTLLGERDGGVGAPDLPRARFLAKQVLRVHPCSNDRDPCVVGSPTSATETPYGALLGADMLAGDALRLRLGSDQVFVLADVGGSELDRSDACDAVFPSPYRGGGTLVIAGTEVQFSGRRVTLQVCMGADPSELVTQAARGADMLMVLSTSIGPSLISESAYERYRQARPTAPPLSTLPAAEVALPSGPIAGRLTTIANLAIVARASSSPRAPCRQVYAHHLLSARDCAASDFDCPCEGSVFCAVPAIVEVQPDAGVEVFVVSDADPTLQALRTELRPDQPEVDGILGTSAIRDAEIDVDYPHNRVLARCSPRPGATATACSTRPALSAAADRARVAACVGTP